MVAIVHPRHEAAGAYYRQADGYFQYSWYVQGALDVGLGASVEYRDRPIGTVVHVEEEGTEIVTTIWVARKYRRFVESHSAYAVGPAGYKSLCIGTPRECHAGSPRY